MPCPDRVGNCRPNSRASRTIVKRSAFTLVELLVSVTLTLLVVFAIVQIFDVLGSNMRVGRALIEMSGQMRTVTNRLQQDLDNVTCQVKPWNDPESGSGYFMYVEGLRSDRDVDGDGIIDANNPINPTHFGDWDDMLAMTVRSPGREFVGRVTYQHTGTGAVGVATVTSLEAEVVWWTAILDTNDNGAQDTEETTILLLRRAFLVCPNLNLVSGGPVIPTGSALVIAQSDLSMRFDVGTNGLALNSLANLTQPTNRALNQRTNWISEDFFHDNFPDLISPDELERTPNEVAYMRGQLLGGYGEHVVLNDLLAFDVRAYDPEAPLVDIGPKGAANRILLSPGDPDYPPVTVGGRGPVRRLIEIKNAAENAADSQLPLVDARYGPNWTARLVGQGAYVDLSYLSAWESPAGAPPALDTRPEYSDVAAIGNDYRISNFSGVPAFRDLPKNPNVGQLEQTGGANEFFWFPFGRLTASPFTDASGFLATSGAGASFPMAITRVAGNSPNGSLNDRRSTAIIRDESATAFAMVPMFVYDTWSSFYERDNVDQDFDNVTDEGTDGLDNPVLPNGRHTITGGVAINGVDDHTERETSPPYPVDLRGIEVRIRMMDLNTRQVRQVSIVGDFVPE